MKIISSVIPCIFQYSLFIINIHFLHITLCFAISLLGCSVILCALLSYATEAFSKISYLLPSNVTALYKMMRSITKHKSCI